MKSDPPQESEQYILEKQQQVARLERNLALQKIRQRKADTRRKIELGGLVIKAELHRYSKATILGALLDSVDRIKQNPDHEKQFQEKGEIAFQSQRGAAHEHLSGRDR